MATITVRALNPVTWDPLYGNGQKNFISDLDAITQIINTRLRLFQGEWFLNLLDGLPLFQKLLGQPANSGSIQVMINTVSQRIAGTVFVTSVNVIEASYQNRSFSYKASAFTPFGTIYITLSPGSLASLASQS
jgi:hypothetical protein